MNQTISIRTQDTTKNCLHISWNVLYNLRSYWVFAPLYGVGDGAVYLSTMSANGYRNASYLSPLGEDLVLMKRLLWIIHSRHLILTTDNTSGNNI